MTLDRVFRLKTVAAENLLIDTRGGIVRLNTVYRLSPAAAWLWDKAQGMDFSKDDLVTWLCEEFDISQSQAQLDVQELVDDWINNGIAS